MIRIIQFLFGCSHFGILECPDVALDVIAQCQRRALHKGPHQYELPWPERA